MTDKTVISSGLPNANVVAAGTSGATASNDASAEGRGHDSASVGAVLRAAREAQGLTPGDISAKLRMGVKQVVALEASDYASLPTGTFLRGFVRNYAKQVGLNSEDVLAILEKTHRSAAAVNASQVVIPVQHNIRMPAPGGELATPKARTAVAGLVVIMLVAAFWYWWQFVRPHLADGGRAKPVTVEQAVQAPAIRPPSDLASPAVTATDPATSPGTAGSIVPAEAAPAAGANPAAATDTPVSASGSPVVAVPVEPAPAKVPDTAPVPPVPKGRGVLGFTFNGDSWVEVVDGNGRTILSKRYRAGDADEVTGRLPLAIVVGNAQASRMAFNGKEFDLVPHTKISVARVTIK
jgi:cytoskeleton protein RodZ